MERLEDMKKETSEQIERIIKKYPWEDSKELFKSELTYLIKLSDKELRRIVTEAYDPVFKTYDYDRIAEGVLEYLNIKN